MADHQEQQGQAPQVQIKADEKELVGQYSNLAMIHHNPEEFQRCTSSTFSPMAPTASWFRARSLVPDTRSGCGARWEKISRDLNPNSGPSVNQILPRRPPMSVSSSRLRRNFLPGVLCYCGARPGHAPA